MTYLRHVPSDLGYEAFPSPHDDAPVALYRLTPARPIAAVARRRWPRADTVFLAALGLIETLLQRRRQRSQARRVRDRLSELDDRLLRDIGLTRADVSFGDISPFGARRRSRG
jgi:uncharacterized protein YjiS (DUF1127 family)